jgi:hypothetical protein
MEFFSRVCGFFFLLIRRSFCGAVKMKDFAYGNVELCTLAFSRLTLLSFYLYTQVNAV